MIIYSLNCGVSKTREYFAYYFENKVDFIFNPIEWASTKGRLEIRIPEMPAQMCPVP